MARGGTGAGRHTRAESLVASHGVARAQGGGPSARRRARQRPGAGPCPPAAAAGRCQAESKRGDAMGSSTRSKKSKRNEERDGAGQPNQAVMARGGMGAGRDLILIFYMLN